jgi:hypothetical protein
LVHWAIIDLAAPGIELYVTPLDPKAVAEGWQYRLRRIGDVVDKERLAVAINGTLFESNSGWWLRMAGDLARGVETVVADQIVSHLWEHTYLLWFDKQLVPHLRPSKPPTSVEFAQAKWGIGGQAVWLHDGKVWPGSSRAPDSRTAVAIDQQCKLLFLAVGQYISPRLMLQELADLGAKDGMLLMVGVELNGCRRGRRWNPAGFCTVAGGRLRVLGLRHNLWDERKIECLAGWLERDCTHLILRPP